MKPYVILLLLLLVGVGLSGIALAEEGAAGDQTVPRSIWEVIFDNALSITLAFIFISALIGTVLRNLSVDKCLRHFDDFHVTLELAADNDLIWGTLHMYSTGLELLYREPRRDSGGHYESSFILYSSEYNNIQTICRYHGDLSEKRRKIREADIRKTYQPTIFARTLRWLRNLVNTFSDAFSKSLNVIIGQMKKLSPGSVILKQDAHLSKIGTDIIGYAGNAYDPILERYIGEKVVIEVTYTDRKEEYSGILKEYTSTFLELLNVRYVYRICVPIKGQGSGKFEISGLYVKNEDSAYLLENQSVTPVRVYEMVKDGVESPLQIEIGSQDTRVVFEDDPEAIDVAVKIETVRTVDLIVPRSKALIRHAGPREKIGWKELLGFDDVESFLGKFTGISSNLTDFRFDR